MSTNVIAFPSSGTRRAEPVRHWSLATALRRLGLVRIAPTSWPDGAQSFGAGRFIAVRADCPTPTRSLLVEVARLAAGPRRAWPFTAAADADDAASFRAGLVADCVRTLAEGHAPVAHVRARLLELPAFERERVARLARRIHEAGLERDAPDTTGYQTGRQRATRGKPGCAKARVRS